MVDFREAELDVDKSLVCVFELPNYVKVYKSDLFQVAKAISFHDGAVPLDFGNRSRALVFVAREGSVVAQRFVGQVSQDEQTTLVKGDEPSCQNIRRFFCLLLFRLASDADQLS